ncbi:MAG: hypothetical protein J2P27_09405 [Actinobacteria bacterium]|nr:hypothetical protein [Actinomycetota bacterium]
MRATVTVATVGTATLLATSGAVAYAVTAAPSTSTSASSSTSSACVSKAHAGPRVGRFGGIISAAPKASCQSASGPALSASGAAGNNAVGTPPLLYHGGPVMSTATTGTLVITPIFWNPAGHPMDPGYVSLITQYLGDVAAASGGTDNVFSTATEYSGTNGTIRYQVQLGTPVNDTGALPKSSCRLTRVDKTGIYVDGSGYNLCIDDAQVTAETNRVVNAGNLPRDLAHIYVLYLPKHVESCFFAGSVGTTKNACTINHEPSAAYCAYHSEFGGNTVYANMPFPIYTSPVGFTCGSDAQSAGLGAVQTPNGNPDADTEVSPSSHEVMEAITDPDTSTGWYDSSGFENGDECAYVFGSVSGPSGQFYNQTINGHHYLTQEEFSNTAFDPATGTGGCLQSEAAA